MDTPNDDTDPHPCEVALYALSDELDAAILAERRARYAARACVAQTVRETGWTRAAVVARALSWLPACDREAARRMLGVA